MTREEAVMRLREDMMDQLYYNEHMMTVKEVANWLYKHNCDEDAEELRKKIEFMLLTMDQEGLEQAYKILQRIWIRHGTQQ